MAKAELSSALRRSWDALPIDGRGLLAPGDPDARYLVDFATNRRLSSVPRAIRPAIIWASRLLWCVKAVSVVASASRKFGFGLRESLRYYADACLYGVRPKDAHAWRRSMSALPPISTQAFWKVALVVGAAEQRRVLTDKLATAAALEKLSVATPKLLAIIPAGTVSPQLPDAAEMFIKPRNGRRSINSFTISRLAPGEYWIDGASHDAAYVTARLHAADDDALLVQRRLIGISDLADLNNKSGGPPTLRIMTASEPQGRPYVHAAWLTAAVPGEPSYHPLRDALRAPISIATGSLLPAYWLGEPGKRFDRSPWHDADITGRTLPGFDAAVDAALTAASAFPGLPLIGWDVILTGDGPVILEGNSATDMLVVTWAEAGAPDAPPLLPLLRRWAAVASPADFG